tara:strand:+ start:113 stop:316 length:204 start_codon:yes stop_codon:yes gene_type:complete
MSEKAITELTKAINALTYEVECTKEEIGCLTNALEKTDDFNNWNLQDSLASIANSFYKYTAIINKRK